MFMELGHTEQDVITNVCKLASCAPEICGCSATWHLQEFGREKYLLLSRELEAFSCGKQLAFYAPSDGKM